MIVPVCLLAGCGSSPTELPVAKSAHGGNLVSLPSGRGFAEILVESAAPGSGGRKAQIEPRVVAYFFQPDGTSEMNPGPTEVKVKVGTGEKSAVVDLSPQPKEAGKYASEPGTYPDGFNGQLDAKVNGEAVQVSFVLR
jgi:hypothetical protein